MAKRTPASKPTLFERLEVIRTAARHHIATPHDPLNIPASLQSQPRIANALKDAERLRARRENQQSIARRRKVVRQMSLSGHSVVEIANATGYSIGYVVQLRAVQGIGVGLRNLRSERVKARVLALSEQGVAVKEIAKRLKLSRPHVSQLRRELGIAPARKANNDS
jgi:AraC-like DNA-binding protein